jgi:AraC-like DNA-binding protein
VYPSRSIPSHRYFDTTKGRKLAEYQVFYVARGEGVFESSSCKEQVVKEGSIIILFPGEWHRFRPNSDIGWDEFWIGFNGDIMDNLVDKYFFSRQSPILEIGVQEAIFNLYQEIIDRIREEKSGYQPLVSGILLNLLGQIHSITKEQSTAQENISEAIINKARFILRANLDTNMEMEKVAEELNVSYAWFRKAFKMYTGMAPNQYLLKLKIEQAKLLTADHSKSIKEIAYCLNFESAEYFSKFFKEKTGMSPEQYRKSTIKKSM